MKGSENCFLFHQKRTSSSLFMNISYIQYVVGFVGNDSLLQFMTLIGNTDINRLYLTPIINLKSHYIKIHIRVSTN